MCVAVPARITWIGDRKPTTIPGRVESAGASGAIDLVMVPDARVGDFVTTHSGYAIRLLAENEIAETLRLFETG